MDVVRNFIHVVGITPEEHLPRKINGQLIQYSDIDTIFIPDELPAAKSIFQVMFHVEVKSGRIIETPICKTMVVDGIKSFKIMYTVDGREDKASFAEITIPYNTFIEMPEGYGDIDKVDVYVLDAYFSLLDSRRIYSYILYLVHAGCGVSSNMENGSSSNGSSINSKKDMEGPPDIPEGATSEMLSKPVSEDRAKPQDAEGNRKVQTAEDDIDAEYL